MSDSFFRFSFETSRCSGCMACVIACMDQNDLDSPVFSFRQVSSFENNNEDGVRLGFVSLACFHCSDAPCLNVCPGKAIFWDNDLGIVDVNPERCIGCQACAIVCPFGVPRFSTDGKMFKCDLCKERVRERLQPACVQVCTTKALTFSKAEENAAVKAKKIGTKFLDYYT